MKKILLFLSIVFFTFSIELHAQVPTNLQSIVNSSTDVNFSWNNTCGSNTNVLFRFRISGSGFPGWSTSINLGPGATSNSLAGLTPSTDYEWTVKCNGSSWATIESFTTDPSVSISAVVLDTIQCYGDLATITVDLSNTISLSVFDTVQVWIGFQSNFSPTYFIKQQATPVSSTTTQAVFTGISPNHNGANPGEYIIRVVDSIPYYTSNNNGSGTSSNGIIQEYSFIVDVDEPNELLATTNSISDISCFGECNADEDLIITGGTKPYNFTMGTSTVNLQNNDSIYSFVGLCDSTYILSVADNNGCLANGGSAVNFTISEPEDLIGGGVVSSNYNGFDIKCNSSLTGEITALTLIGASGSGAIQYSIDGNPFSNNSIFSALSAGNHIIIYRDTNLCLDTQIINLSEPLALSGAPIVTEHVTCFGNPEGDLEFILSATEPGSGNPYTFSIDGNNFQSSNVFENNLAGIYSVTIKDINDCLFSDTITINQPEEILYSFTVSDYNGFEISCLGSNDGFISFNPATGGLGPIGYSINNGSNFSQSFNFNNLDSGQYVLIVQDSVLCQKDTIINLNDPGQFEITYINNSLITCPSYCNGEIQINNNNGAGQILYNINGGAQQTTSLFSGLCDSGGISDTITATDGNGCVDTLLAIISEPSDFIFNTGSVVEYCSQSNGEASISVTSGGTGAGTYTYLWNTIPFQSSSSATNISAGSYTVTVTDANNCTFNESVNVGEDLGFQVTFTTVSPCLGDSSGSATSSVIGGTPNYTYQWSDINGVILSETSATIDDMPVGTYTLSVTDNGVPTCTVIESVDILPPSNLIVIDSIVVVPSSCYGIDDAQIEIFASGGQQPYEFSINNGLLTLPNSLFSSLSPATYLIRAIDNNDCFDDTTIIVSYPTLLEIDSTIFTDINCFGANDGAIQAIQFIGGTPPYQFSVDGGPLQTYMSFSGIGPNQHTVEILDANNCGAQDIIFIDEPSLIQVNMSPSNWNNYQIQCFNDSSGYVHIDVSGATPPYFIDNISFIDTITVENYPQGTHTFLVNDSRGCEYQETFTFNEPSLIQHNFIETHIICRDDGTIIDSVYGGVGSSNTYQYLWSTGETSYSLDSLSPGWYNITVTDLNGCQSIDSVEINNNNAFSADSLSGADLSCFEINNPNGMLSVSVIGGTQPYTYLWNDSQGQTNDTAMHLAVDPNLLNSNYHCLISDAYGCSDTVFFTLTMPEKFEVDLIISSPISCNGQNDGKLTAEINNSSGSVSYLWQNNETAQTILNAISGFYEITATDGNGCLATDSIYLPDPDSVEVYIDEFDIKCFGEEGYIELIASGGTSFENTYTYSLFLDDGDIFVDSITFQSGSNNIDTLIFDNLNEATYYVVVMDRNECEVVSEIVEISEPSELKVNIENIHETCDDEGIINIYPIGGSEDWACYIDGDFVGNIAGIGSSLSESVSAGNHDIEIKDSRGCSVEESTLILAYDLIFLPNYVNTIDTSICLGQSIVIDIDEKSGLEYVWNDGLVQADRIIEPSGLYAHGQEHSITYVVTITDENDCVQENYVVVNFESIDPMVESDPEKDYGAHPVVLLGDNIRLFSNNNDGEQYFWSWSTDTITNTNGINELTNLQQSDWYYLSMIDEDGCLGYDSIKVVVGVKVYEYITPNNDGYNDEWLPVDIQSYPDALLQVFNRWGSLVWESGGGLNLTEGEGWDGTNEGKELPVGTYYYIIDLMTGDDPQTGPITIIR